MGKYFPGLEKPPGPGTRSGSGDLPSTGWGTSGWKKEEEEEEEKAFAFGFFYPTTRRRRT
jgi:hypothetical protein